MDGAGKGTYYTGADGIYQDFTVVRDDGLHHCAAWRWQLLSPTSDRTMNLLV